ncbi:hypothetical protein LMH73_013140 [Vibrio splendidus]|nr:hypothetical protein [Vibrio splendidus]MCC4880711.1 hypothetical protein [Vibrio splendidus]
MTKPHITVALQYLETYPEFQSPVCNSDKPTDCEHLAWMLLVIASKEEVDMEHSDEKMNRWLGYVQGVMVMKGMLNVDSERKRTRTIFNGK